MRRWLALGVILLVAVPTCASSQRIAVLMPEATGTWAMGARLGIEELAQPRILGLERGEPLQAEFRVEPVAFQALVLGHEGLPRREVRADVRPAAERHVDEHADGIDEDRKSLPHALEVLVAMIEDHEREADERQQQEPRAHGEPTSRGASGGSSRTPHSLRSLQVSAA